MGCIINERRKSFSEHGKHTHIYPPDARRPKAFRHPIVISAPNRGKESQANAKNG